MPIRIICARSIFRFLLSIGLCVIADASITRAQTSEEAILQDLKDRAMRIINTTMQTLNEHTADFNAHIGKMNQSRPLEVQNLDSAKVSGNISNALGFIDYLTNYVAFDDSLSRALEDSMETLKDETPTGAEEKALDAFTESYIADHKAWDAYLGTLKNLYSEVLDVLLFLQKTDHSIAKDQLQFHNAKDAATYRKRMKAIEGTVQESQKAIEASKKATAAAEKKIEEINGKPLVKKKKKK